KVRGDEGINELRELVDDRGVDHDRPSSASFLILRKQDQPSVPVAHVCGEVDEVIRLEAGRETRVGNKAMCIQSNGRRHLRWRASLPKVSLYPLAGRRAPGDATHVPATG